MNRLLMAVLAAMAGGCTYLPFLQVAPADYRYVLIGPEGIPVARAITSDAACPAIELDGVARPMTVRMAPGTIPLRPTRSEPALSKPSAFPVLTCELAIPAGTTRAAIGGQPLPLPVADPQRIVVIGDTGCRIKVGDNVYQDCDDPARWPFERVANAAAASKPDLVIHVGDYHYRENACPAGNPATPKQPYPGNAGLQSVLQPLHPTVLFPPNVLALLAGHNHLFEAVSFSSGQPPQFVSGNAGDWVDEPFPAPFPAGLQPAPGAVVAELVASNRFGFMTMERDGARWAIQAWDVHGALLTSCTLAERKATCAPIAQPWSTTQ